jgi:hypothetical protein
MKTSKNIKETKTAVSSKYPKWLDVKDQKYYDSMKEEGFSNSHIQRTIEYMKLLNEE